MMFAGLLILAAGAVWWVRSGKADMLVERARPMARELSEIYGPPLAETFSRYKAGKIVFAHAAVPPVSTATPTERIARLLVLCGEPMLADDTARELDAPGNLRERTRLVRAELRGCRAFKEVSRGRWMLGDVSECNAVAMR